MTYELAKIPSIGTAFDKGFKLYKENFSLVFLSTLVAILVGSVTCGIITPVLLCGLYSILLRLLRGSEPKPVVGDLFSQFSKFWPAFLSCLVLGLVFYVVSVVVMLVPVVGWAAGYAINIGGSAVTVWATLMVLEKNATTGEAINSFKILFSKDGWMWVLLVFVASMLGALGAIACGIGVLFTFPFTFCMIAAAYDECGARPSGGCPASEDCVEAEVCQQ
ncbi:MAG: hypothetical protein J6U17_06290 [Kiritimatiellae bacterium]|nr:hypothetical protein [Kiritimatiellia bacterium]